eukprot:TRINITY_DN20690_c0_g1_i1.p1 TRINITY_DN20690_c0_g1~~TRINITY_DN20690_c0_g1_i1.p1  ORF type:complete len:536 (+),score=72.57 TRINITY_DN20690_c0_g1_i1:151-1758(+)
MSVVDSTEHSGKPAQYHLIRKKYLEGNTKRSGDEWYLRMRAAVEKKKAEKITSTEDSNNRQPQTPVPKSSSKPKQHSNGSSGVRHRRQHSQRNSATGSPIVAKQDARYLCERALRLQLYGNNIPSTAGCSTITQDIELESCSSEKTVNQDESSLSSQNSLDNSVYATRNSIERDVEFQAGTTDVSKVEKQCDGFEEIPIDCSVYNRYSGPEGMGPVSAGKITALTHQNQLLVVGTETGRIYIIETSNLSDKPTLLPDSHEGQVIDLVLSESGQCLLSISLDKTIRIWWIESANETRCVRVIQEPGVPICVLFTPSNNNIFSVGTVSSFLKFYNLSTGKVLKKHKLKRSSGCMAWGHEPSVLCMADTGGRVSSCYYDFMNHNVKRISTVTLERGVPVTSLTRQGNLLLANAMCDSVYLLKLCPNALYTLSIVNKICIPHQRVILRSSFCPEELLFATGAEDGTVRMVQFSEDTSRPPKVLKLQGHQGAVLNVSVSSNGNIASGDELGCVMVWKYDKRTTTNCKMDSSIQDCSEDKS